MGAGGQSVRGKLAKFVTHACAIGEAAGLDMGAESTANSSSSRPAAMSGSPTGVWSRSGLTPDMEAG